MRNILLFSLFLVFISPLFLVAQNGVVKTYYDDGTIESELSYINDILDGYSIFYFPNGNLREEIPFSYGKVHGLHRKYFMAGLIKEESTLKEGILDGIYKIFYENGQLKRVMTYDNGKLIKNVNVPFDPSFSAPLDAYLAGNRQYKISKEANIISDVEICPVPLNGITEIQNNLVYPKSLENKSISGAVTLSVRIDSTGRAFGTEIVKSLDSEFDEAAKKAVEGVKFLPGRQGNKIVESKIVLNVEYKPAEKKPAVAEAAADSRKELKEIVKLAEKKIEVQERTVEILKETAKVEKIEAEPPKKEIVKEVEAVIPQKEIKQDVRSTNEDPRPNGGIERIIARMKIPRSAIDSKIEGEAIVKVEVDKYGVIRDITFVKGLGKEIDESIENAINASPFIAGRINGEKVKASVVLHIPFSYKQ